MSHARLSASGGERATACPVAYALPADPPRQSDDAKRGTECHRYLELAQEISPVIALASVDESVRETCEGIPIYEIPRGKPEIAFVYNVRTDTARCLGKLAEHRQYGETDPDEIPLTIDLVVYDVNTGWEVVDWKFGHYENVPLASKSMQIKLAALAVARHYKLDRITASIIRFDPDGTPHKDSITLDSWDLDGVAAEWTETKAGVDAARAAYARGERLSVNPGEHCRYCPSQGSCPAFADTSSEIVAPSTDWLARFRSAIDDDASAAEWWAKIARAEEIVRTMRGLIEARATTRPIPLADGSHVGVRISSRDRVVDADAVHSALVDLYGAEVADAACETERKTTKAKIESAIAKHIGKGGAAAEKRRALRVIVERGGIESRESRVVDVITKQIERKSA